jgi:polysaccharide export outer membrane protein
MFFTSRVARLFLFVAAASSLALITGCSTLPDSGPSAGSVASRTDGDASLHYEYVDINNGVIDALKRRPNDSLVARFGDGRMPAEPPIGVGDTLSVTIWEASAGGLFSSPLTSDKLSAGLNSATIPEQVVGRDGAISIPYAGRIKVAGRVPRDVQTAIEAALEGKAVKPQVLVTISRALSNTVSIEGEVGTPGRVPLSVKGDRLLDILSASGGSRTPVNETFVELARGKETSQAPLSRIIANPSENIYLRPGDTITVVRQPQTFIAYGATGRDAQIPFESDGLTLGEAIAKANGLTDSRADPAGVFIFRYENEAAARAVRPSSPLIRPGETTPIVYHLDLSNPASLFLQQHFAICDRDVIYVANSPSTTVQKIFEIVSPSISVAGSAATIANTVQTVH